MKYSIIIPHKNIPDLLQRCIDSIPQRNDLEVIVVDDNSHPDKVDFNHFPGDNRQDVKTFFTKEGKGAGYARNIGLKHAKGEWIIFSDSDDYFNTANLNELLDKDLSSFDVVAWLCMKVTPHKNEIFKKDETLLGNCESLFLMNEPWRKMVRQSLISRNEISFQEVSVSNDIYFSMLVASVCERFFLYPEIVYYWVTREDSLSAKYKGEMLITALEVSLRTNVFLKSINKEKYFDRTKYYLALQWKENKKVFLSYLIKTTQFLGFRYSCGAILYVYRNTSSEDNVMRKFYRSLLGH